MSAELWNVQHHVIPAAHVRGNARGVRKEETARLRLAIKHYIPRARTNPRSGDLSIVFCQGVGSSKEPTEPFFDDLLRTASGPRIRGIWCMDVAHHGESYMLNAEHLGDEPCWRDSARDLIHMINTFGEEIKTPIIGIGSSWGAVTIIYASNLHPRLFRGIILVEPTLRVQRGAQKSRYRRVMFMVKREEMWPSRAAAREALIQIKSYYALFDPRVFEKIIQYELVEVDEQTARDAGVTLQPGESPVRLRTPKAMEVYTMVRKDMTIPGYFHKSALDADEDDPFMRGFYSPDGYSLDQYMPYLLPKTLVAWGELSDVPRVKGYRQHLLNVMGKAPGGGGGVEKGQLEEVWVEGSKHSVPFEKPTRLAEKITPWLLRQAEDWELEMKQRTHEAVFWTDTINPDWVRRLEKL